LLVQLSIRDLVLIEQVSLDLEPGLTVLTGETGAGKSILLDGLGLALGERADAQMVRKGAAQASASAAFRVDASHPAALLVEEQGLAGDEAGAILLRRTLKADGGSRAFVNDVAVSAGLLRQVGALLVEVHGQNDERGLLNPRGHLALLDAFAGHDALLGEVGAAHAAWRAAGERRVEAEARAEADARDRDWLAHASAELAALKPRAGEEAELADARAAMQKGAKLAESLGAIDALVSTGDGALAQLRQAARRLERIADADPALAAALDAVDRALAAGDEVESALADVRRRFLVSPDALETAEARLFELRALARKHRVEVDALPALADDLASRLAAVDDAAGTIAALQAAEDRARAHFDALARQLSAARHSAAARLDAAVNAQLPALKLDAARFRTALAAALPAETGTDQARFEVATNAGTDFGALTRIASGGEMSRFTLALKVALAATGTAQTLIFDEIDRGVGGATASAIGQRLAQVSTQAQTLVVTHSPQVAAAGHHHARIAKTSGQTTVHPLTPEDRPHELARMLSGAEVTPHALAQAVELLKQARGAAPGPRKGTVSP
jgi:DNA repair protein RecN (Recombination protein N)